ncbi:zinc finger protein 62 homolog [Ylistrum balloti]|uniref:zinc finger protein 62 homolog n=1 Tax=Ylistrum balloti TaxID=509963 RepID=UPI002905C2C0|nr:zinc finger protein 62 homolog [Ylistrum balloti]
MECTGGTDMDINKIYSDSMNFLVQDRQRLHGQSKLPFSSEKDFSRIGMAENFMNGRSSSPIGSGFESDKFKNDVMFSSASMLESSAEGCSTSGSNSKITTKPLMCSGHNMVYSEEFGQKVSTDLPVTDIKKEPSSEEEEVMGTYYRTNSQTVFPEMMTSPVKGESDLGISSAHSETSQENVSYVIKQEPLTDDDDVNDNDVGNEMFGDFLLKGNDADDSTSNSITEQNEENKKKRKSSMIETTLSDKRVKRKSTAKLYKKFGDEFHMDKIDHLDEDSHPNDSEEEYTPSIYIDRKGNKIKSMEDENKEIDVKTPSNKGFLIKNIEGNMLNIKGTSKNLHVKIFKCPECNDIFTYESVFKKHMRKHTGDMPFKCKHCKHGFMTQFSHDLHSRVHTPDRSYKCGICGENMKLKKELKEHNAMHARTKKAQQEGSSSVKSEPTENSTGTNENMSDVGLSPFGCSMCVFVARDFAEIGNHVMESHFVDKRCFCDICSRRFANTDDLKAHKAIHDGQYEEISCGICEEIVDSKDDLMKHLDIHPEAKPYRCCHCGDRFIVLPQLRNHMQTHSFTKRYNCPHCLKQFFHEDTLESHLRVHTGEISYICPVCDKGFRAKDRLRIHMRQHHLTYSLFENYENVIADNAGDSLKELRNKVNFNEDDRSGPQENSTECTNSSESGTQDRGGKLQSENYNSHLEEHRRFIQKKIDPDTEEIAGESDATCRDNMNGICSEMINSSNSAVFEKLRRQGGLDGSKVSSSGTDGTGTPFCISVKKLTKVPISNQPCESTNTKQINANLQFAEMENTMKLQMNIYQCKICGAMFAYNNMLRKHMKKHTGDEPYRCDVCGHGYMSSSALKAHKMVHSGERPYACEKCPKAFRQKSSLKSHLHLHETQKVIEHILSKRTDKEAGLLQQRDAFGCSICDSTFSDVPSISSHINKVHFKELYHACDVCSKRFDSMQSLEEHQTAHVDSKNYACGICGRDFSEEDELSDHLNEHPTAKPFKCQVCYTQFISLTVFATHMDIHLADKSVVDTTNQLSNKEQPSKQFPCKYCDRVFSTSVQRWAHSAVHEKARPYSCSICGKKYVNKGSLTSHEESHEKGKGKRSPRLDKTKKKTSTLPKLKTRTNSSEESSDLLKGNQTLLDFGEDSGNIGDDVDVPDALDESYECERLEHEDFGKEHIIKTEPISTGYCDEELNIGLLTEPQSTERCETEADVGHKTESLTTEYYNMESNIGSQTEQISTGYCESNTIEFKTEPLSPESCDIESDIGLKMEPISTGYYDMKTDIGEVNLSLQDQESFSGLHTSTDESIMVKTASFENQMEVKTEQDDDSLATKPKYGCIICGKNYMNQQSLNNHEKCHSVVVSEPVVSEPVELICTECGADFWKKSDLNKHIRRHHNETSKPSFRSKLKKVKNKNNTIQNA